MSDAEHSRKTEAKALNYDKTSVLLQANFCWLIGQCVWAGVPVAKWGRSWINSSIKPSWIYSEYIKQTLSKQNPPRRVMWKGWVGMETSPRACPPVYISSEARHYSAKSTAALLLTSRLWLEPWVVFLHSPKVRVWGRGGASSIRSLYDIQP